MIPLRVSTRIPFRSRKSYANEDLSMVHKHDWKKKFKIYCRDLFMIFDGHARKKMQLFGKVVSSMMIGAIVLGIISTVLSTNPDEMVTPTTCSDPVCNNDPSLCPEKMICAPVGPELFNKINDIVTIIFVVDYVVRFCTVWACNSRQADLLPMSWYLTHKPSDEPPYYPLQWHYFHFVLSIRNIIDLAAILPYFVHLAVPSIQVNSNFVRILRLVRVFGLMNRHPVIKQMLSVVLQTLLQSAYALGVLMLLSIISVIFFAAIVFALEGGKYAVTEEYPYGVYLRKSWVAGQQSVTVTPFNSMGTCIYYCITTMTTVGYGDVTPTTVGGRIVANMMMYCGIVLLALPIGVISSNFSDNYHKVLRIEKNGKPLDEAFDDWHEVEDASDGEDAVKTRRASMMVNPANRNKILQAVAAHEARNSKVVPTTSASASRNKGNNANLDITSKDDGDNNSVDSRPYDALTMIVEGPQETPNDGLDNSDSSNSSDVSSISDNVSHGADAPSKASTSKSNSKYKQQQKLRKKLMPWLPNHNFKLGKKSVHNIESLKEHLVQLEKTLEGIKKSLL